MFDALFNRIYVLFHQTAKFGATFAWCTIALVTFIDVIGRTFFSYPLPGGYEIIQSLMAVGIMLSLPIVALHKEHIEVDVLQHFFSPSIKAFFSGVSYLIGVLFFGYLTYAMFLFTKHAKSVGDRTIVLKLPHWHSAAIMVIFLFATCLCTIIAIERVRKNVQKLES